MKQGLLALSGIAWVQLAAAACCRSNQCLKAVAAPALRVADGIQDCSSLLVVTVTPEAGTVTETVTDVPIEYATVVTTAVVTETVTTTAATETQLVTLGATVTAATQTDAVTVTTTIVATHTELQTVTATVGSGGSSRILPRGNTLSAPPTTDAEAASTPAVPAYATADCPSWNQYVSACKCAGVTATTVTADAPAATTVTVSNTDDAVTVTVPATVSATETVFVSLTATTAATAVDTVSLTATIAITETATFSTTVTVTETVTETVEPQATCRPGSEVGPFYATATEFGGSPLQFYANMLNALSGGLNWTPGTTSTSPSAKNKYIFKIDADGYLALGLNLPPYTFDYIVYMSTASATGSNWPQVGTRASVENSIALGGKVTKLKGCVNSVTGELTLDAAGRTNILYCGAQVWMSFGAGEDINRGTCVKMFPKVSAAV
ncbi:hypothetical protein C8A05DRAFT_37646 [Staphylotrichum tortipilum]|uniref:Uncharacterized protein n=1 Tax=Staphylotrichum tortipilum TaxID=2831512 RepID=A0AAN6RPL5_9PEZI|nr:hypothetical protein C8A05DRAFT_37646 [Staphylotrichum longicolle]